MARTDSLDLGKLRHAVDLQVPSGTSGDGYETAVPFVPCQIRSAGGNELLRFGTQVSVNASVITMPFRSDLRADMRLYAHGRYEGKKYQVVSYGDETGEGKWLDVYVTEQLQ